MFTSSVMLLVKFETPFSNKVNKKAIQEIILFLSIKTIYSLLITKLRALMYFLGGGGEVK